MLQQLRGILIKLDMAGGHVTDRLIRPHTILMCEVIAANATQCLQLLH